MHVPLIIIGGGLSGLAAALRFARFIPDVLVLERHSRLGGLNSYYYRNKRLFETGLHAITNYAAPKDKKAPLNRLLRQLKLKRKDLQLHQQLESEIRFLDEASLRFSNDFQLLCQQIETKFTKSFPGFLELVSYIDGYDPFRPAPFRSAKILIQEKLHNTLLTDMLLCPLMYYGSSIENDMDLGQFVIMFRAIFQEGMFRPAGTIKDLIDLLEQNLTEYGGTIRTKAGVKRIITENNTVQGIELHGGEEIQCDHILSTIGSQETYTLLGNKTKLSPLPRLGFIETIYELPGEYHLKKAEDKTIIFYNDGSSFNYANPQEHVDLSSGVICMPQHFSDLPPLPFTEVRTTHLANYGQWKLFEEDKESYENRKDHYANRSLRVAEKILGNFGSNVVYRDTFTPLTIERFTAKKEGAIYGSPAKIKDGDIGYNNLFLAGTDQGFLGIVGAMLSGVSMVNQHILPRI